MEPLTCLGRRWRSNRQRSRSRQRIRKWWRAPLRKVYAKATIKRRTQSSVCLNHCQSTQCVDTIYDQKYIQSPPYPDEIGNPTVLGPQVEIQPAAQPKTPEDTQVVACPSTQSVRKSHHKKKDAIKCLPQPLSVPQCVDTI